MRTWILLLSLLLLSSSLIACSPGSVGQGAAEAASSLASASRQPLSGTQQPYSVRDTEQDLTKAAPSLSKEQRINNAAAMIIPPLTTQRSSEVSEFIIRDIAPLIKLSTWQTVSFTRFPNAYLDRTTFRYILIGQGQAPTGETVTAAYFIPLQGPIKRVGIFTQQFEGAPFTSLTVQLGDLRILFGAANSDVRAAADSVYLRRMAESRQASDAIRSTILHNGMWMFIFEQPAWEPWSNIKDIVFMYSQAKDPVYLTGYPDGAKLENTHWKLISE